MKERQKICKECKSDSMGTAARVDLDKKVSKKIVKIKGS